MEPRGEGRSGGTGVRCFVAIDLASDVLVAIEGMIAVLRRTDADVRWIPPENLHVTLKFLGQLPEARVGVVRTTLASVAAATRPFNLAAAGLGGFPNVQRPRVVWLGLRGSGFGALVVGVEDALTREGFPRETRAVTPHVTIGRVRSPRGWSRTLEAMRAYRDRAFGESRVNEIVLYRSELRSQGAQYSALDRLPFAQSVETASDEAV